jgi:toxin-antitoxin system PIN domain toxin
MVPDVNLLLYAHLDAFPEHARARRWWKDALSGEREVGIAAPALFGFVRIATNPRVFDPPLPLATALEHAGAWLARPRARFLLPGPRHLGIAFGLLRALGTAANLTTDVQLAALAIEHQAELCSHDTDFGRFPGLRWTDPLAD